MLQINLSQNLCNQGQQSRERLSCVRRVWEIKIHRSKNKTGEDWLNTSLSILNYSRNFPLHHLGCIISLRFKGKDFFEQFLKKTLTHFKNQKHFPILSESKEFWDGALLEIFLVPVTHCFHEKTLYCFLMQSCGLLYMWLFIPLWNPREDCCLVTHWIHCFHEVGRQFRSTFNPYTSKNNSQHCVHNAVGRLMSNLKGTLTIK